MNHATNKLASLASVVSMTLAIVVTSGCMGSRYLSQDITDEGHVRSENIVFPDMDYAWQKQGQFPNSENLAKIRPGIDKDELYQLIGRPHFSEGNSAREWDYIMKFYLPDESVKICQYKIIFDKDYKGQEFYWSPADCPPEPKVEGSTAVQETINISADALFEFDQSGKQDMLPQGRLELDALAQQLRAYEQVGNSKVVITGHTDRKGDAMYNMGLSFERAQSVANYLISQGVNPNMIIATGAGELQPIVQCSTNLPRQQEIDCLQPNRRVTLNVTVSQ